MLVSFLHAQNLHVHEAVQVGSSHQSPRTHGRIETAHTRATGDESLAGGFFNAHKLHCCEVRIRFCSAILGLVLLGWAATCVCVGGGGGRGGVFFGFGWQTTTAPATTTPQLQGEKRKI